jgi:hypothetical protein
MSKAHSRRDNGVVLHTFTVAARGPGRREEEAQRKRWKESRQTETVKRIKLRGSNENGDGHTEMEKKNAHKKIVVAIVRGWRWKQLRR